ncbi:two-component system catabolic regulation response regulator CreB [Luteimonas cucumeris]|uniref:Two-component system catabolic regulation response regulator CreB n=1 Tax=Luteimonas cucumeris TaxID=985012 RepID=A0A562L6Z2_9GAMM|nr:two-component system response regulator CreB [Luteimonas cucumeris]TWI03420.1 two-component system catabolic regulation response regulator CreB [Luteimonas cucumeris]
MVAHSQTILLAEDETAIADAVLYALRSEGFVVEHCLLGGEVAPRLRAGGVDLLLLDVGLPDISGFDVCRQLRGFSDLPVIFLTARNDEIDRVLGLELGADDYVAKPFSPRELVARVRARLRRHVPAENSRKRGDFEIDREGRRIRYAGRALDLTRYEYALLAELLRRPGAILSRAQLLDRAWDDDSDSADRTVDTHVKTLRHKLREAGAERDPIRTHRGVGYSIEV